MAPYCMGLGAVLHGTWFSSVLLTITTPPSQALHHPPWSALHISSHRQPPWEMILNQIDAGSPSIEKITKLRSDISSGSAMGSAPHHQICFWICRDQGVDLGRDLEDSVGAIVPSMDAARVTVGKGGEVVRTAICRQDPLLPPPPSSPLPASSVLPLPLSFTFLVCSPRTHSIPALPMPTLTKLEVHPQCAQQSCSTPTPALAVPHRRLIQTTSMVGIPLSPTQRTCLYQHTLNNLHHASPDIQRCAQAALAAFARRYLPSGGAAQGVAGGHCTGGQDSPPDASDSLEDSLELSTRRFLRDMEEAQGGLPARRGSVLALAALPW